jgi:hypothetical protein
LDSCRLSSPRIVCISAATPEDEDVVLSMNIRFKTFSTVGFAVAFSLGRGGRGAEERLHAKERKIAYIFRVILQMIERGQSGTHLLVRN